MADRKLVRLSAILLAAGVVLSLVVGLFHPGREDPNNHTAVFSEYAASASWTPVHFGQFVAFAVLIAGLVCLYFALKTNTGMAGVLNQFAAISALITLALDGVLQAVDGVALKRAVDAWLSAPAAEKATRFASAEGIRWLEEGTRSYQEFMLGLTFVLFAILIVWKASVPRPVGILMGLSGLGYIALGLEVGSEGFSSTHGLTQLPTYIFVFAWVIWLVVSAWRMKGAVESSSREAALPQN